MRIPKDIDWVMELLAEAKRTGRPIELFLDGKWSPQTKMSFFGCKDDYRVQPLPPQPKYRPMNDGELIQLARRGVIVEADYGDTVCIGTLQYNAGHEFVDMTERYEDGGADYTEWLRNEISADRRKDPSVYKLTELRHMTRPTFIKDTAPMGLSSLLDWVHERETEPDKGGEADRVLDTMKTVGSFG